MTAKYGTPYFQNFINSDMKPNQTKVNVLPASA